MTAGTRSDDIAVLVAKLVSTSFRYELDADLRHLRDLRGRLRTWLGAFNGDGAAMDELLLGINEAAANALEHAGTGTGEPAPVLVEARVEGGRVLAEVTDHGRWRERPPAAPRGRGLDVIGAVTDELRIDRGPDGTSVRITKLLSHPVVMRSG